MDEGERRERRGGSGSLTLPEIPLDPVLHVRPCRFAVIDWEVTAKRPTALNPSKVVSRDLPAD